MGNPTVTDPNPFVDLKIGVNPAVLAKLVEDWQGKATDEELLAAHDLGVAHWPALAASADFGGHGVLQLTLDRKVAKEDRTYSVAPFPVGSIPKPLRPAFTAAVPGHVLIDLDWKASHWQLLAFQSGDAALIADLRAGDIYTSLFPGIDRSRAKAGLNTVLNGGGLKSLTDTIGGEAEAKAFLDRAHELLNTRWPKANAHLRSLRAEAVKQGWVTSDREYAGGGVALMRAEAANLRAACSHPKLVEAGMRVVLPLHDGVLLSAPAEVAAKIAEKVAMVMVAMSTGSADEARNNTATWCKWEVSASWRGTTPQLVGADLRSAALRACASQHPADLVMAAAAVPDALTVAVARHHHATSQRRAVRDAVAAVDAAVQWHRTSTESRADRTDGDLVTLPHREGSYSNMCSIIRGDKSLPTPRWNVRESVIYVDGEELTDTVIRQVYLTAMETRYRLRRPSEAMLTAALTDVARESEYDPVRDYFDGLQWDGVARLSTWLHDYAGAADLADSAQGAGLTRVYGEKWMLSIVARAYEPGCKVDTMLVLMGDQGARKSSLLRAVAPCGSFAAVQVDPGDKDSVLRASRVAIVEWPELAGASRREQEALKDYFSLQEDRVRPPYARGDIKIPRRVVFAATTNEDDFLRDATGSRRYWPLKVDRIDLDGLAHVKDQLWAEAVDLYRFVTAADHDHKWWLTPGQDAERARQAEHFTAEDPLKSKVWSFVRANGGQVTLDAVLDHLDVKPTDRTRMAKPVAAVLRALNLTSKTVKEGGQTVRRWVHPDAPNMHRTPTGVMTAADVTETEFIN
jgi:predicted P-loop ATPase